MRARRFDGRPRVCRSPAAGSMAFATRNARSTSIPVIRSLATNDSLGVDSGRLHLNFGPVASERHRASEAKRFVFLYHDAMAENWELTKAMARLDALTDWERRPRGTMRVGLAPMLDLAARLGDPQKAFRSIHVAGTKGKGSVSALIEAALAHAGLRVGRYGSPHVERVTERVSVQGREIDEASLARALNRALDAYEAAHQAKTPAADATWFDLLTAAAFLIFREAGVEWAVVEVGLGGRLDSTNVVNGEIAVVTNIGLEHTEILGKTRAAIAREKAGILKPGAVLVTTLDAGDEAGRVLQARADELGCPVIRARSTGATIEEANVDLAGAVLDQLGEKGARAR